jgi:hypothetical protein
MKKAVLILASILATFFAKSQNITGQWSGKLNMNGNEINVVFDIKGKGNNMNAKLYNAGQTRRGIDVDVVSFRDSIITLRITNAKIEFSGALISENTLAGGLTQKSVYYPLELKKGYVDLTPQAKAKIRRPESVKDVYSYYNEEVVFENKREKMVLVGKLSTPIKKESSPAIILLCGNQLHSSENEKKPNTQVESIVDYLSSCGVAVFHFDSRENYSTASKPNHASINTTDVEAIIECLKKRKEICGDKIKVIDQSNCGLLSQMMAASEGNNLLAELPDLNLLFNENKSKTDFVYRSANNSISTNNLYELGKWALQSN